MKTLYIIVILFLGGTIFAQQNTEELLASNDLNFGKSQQTILSREFQQLDAESLNGIYKLTDDNGNLQEVRTFNKGKLDGTWLQYDANQNLIAIANYKNDQKHGKWIIWDEKGAKRYELFYENGKRTGTWSSWNESGDLISEKKY